MIDSFTLTLTENMKKPHILGIGIILLTMTSYLIGLASPKRINSIAPATNEDLGPVHSEEVDKTSTAETSS